MKKSKGKRRKSKRELLKGKLDTLAKTAAKERDNYTCQKCEVEATGSGMHGSHVIPVSAGDNLRWDINNLKALCYHCHMNWWHKNPTESGIWFTEKFPERYKYLLNKKEEKITFTMEDLEEMKIKLENEIKKFKEN